MLTTTAMVMTGIALLLVFGALSLVGLLFKLVGGVFELVFGLLGAVLGALGTVFGLVVGAMATLFAMGIVVLVLGALALPILLPLALLVGVVWLVVRAVSPRPTPAVLPPAPPIGA